ncbi:MAG: thiosulfate oxidation carrier protein SoxY [Thiobacillaceae bacterium]
MNALRRNVLKGTAGIGALSVAVAAGLLKFGEVLADWNQAAFDAKKVADSLTSIGALSAVNTDKIILRVPDIAENSASVPVEITVDLPDVDSLYILAEMNAHPLIADYNLTDFGGYMFTRIKMGQTAAVRVIVKAGGKVWTAAKEVTITVRGCGGGDPA